MITIDPEIKGLIFDCDGTVVDTMPLHYRAWVNVLEKFGIEFSEPLFYSLAGITTPAIVDVLNQKFGHALSPEDVAHLKEVAFEELLPQAQPIQPVVDVIKQQYGKLPMAIATGGIRRICTKTLEGAGLLRFFKAIVTADDVVYGKPAPDIFLEAARRIGVRPELCMAFEDGDLGIRSAKAAGMKVLDVRPLL